MCLDLGVDASQLPFFFGYSCSIVCLSLCLALVFDLMSSFMLGAEGQETECNNLATVL